MFLVLSVHLIFMTMRDNRYHRNMTWSSVRRTIAHGMHGENVGSSEVRKGVTILDFAVRLPLKIFLPAKSGLSFF